MKEETLKQIAKFRKVFKTATNDNWARSIAIRDASQAFDVLEAYILGLVANLTNE